jgi:CRP-like cAMP-binding protein
MENNDTKLKTFLSRLKIFKDCTPEEIDKILSIVSIEHYDENTVIFKENSPGDKFYIIRNGVVDIKKHILMDWGLETVTLSRLNPGDIFGEFSLLDNNPRSASAIALFPTELIAIDNKTFRNFIHENPTIGVKILLHIATDLVKKLRATDEIVKALTQRVLTI